MKNIIVCLIIIITFSCINEENTIIEKNKNEILENQQNITITKKIVEYIPIEGTDDAQPETIAKEYIITEKLSINTEQLILRVPIRTYIKEITGVERLINLKRLLIGNGLIDISFLKNIVNLEVLIVENRNDSIYDLNNLQKFSELKILYVNNLFLEKNTINLINNKKLKFIYLGNLNNPNLKHFELYFKNIPKSLDYLDLSLSFNVKITKMLLDSLINIPNVIIYNHKRYSVFDIEEKDLKSYPNVSVGLSQDLLPEKYQKKQIYGLFGISEVW